jgi:hypothetical protein
MPKKGSAITLNVACGRPGWSQKAVLLPILIPLTNLLLAPAWIWSRSQMTDVPLPAGMALPLLLFGVNFGVVVALARLQNNAHQKWENEGPEAMRLQPYDVGGAAHLARVIAGVIMPAGTFIFSLLR